METKLKQGVEPSNAAVWLFFRVISQELIELRITKFDTHDDLGAVPYIWLCVQMVEGQGHMTRNWVPLYAYIVAALHCHSLDAATIYAADYVRSFLSDG